MKWVLKNSNKSIEELENKIKSLEERISNIQNNQCPICIDKVKNPCLSPCCKQTFCFKCVTMSVNYDSQKRCPMCRKPLNLSNLTLLDNSANTIEVKEKITN